jgi:preprotein translocase subunit SecD
VLAAGRFEARPADEHPTPGLGEAAIVGTDQKIYLHAEPLVENRDIAQVLVVPDDSASAFGVSLTFRAEGAARMLRGARIHIGRPLAILVDRQAVAAPVVRSSITTVAIMSGNYSRAEAERIVSGIVGR